MLGSYIIIIITQMYECKLGAAGQPIPTFNCVTNFGLLQVSRYAVCLEYTHENIPGLDSLNNSILMLFHSTLSHPVILSCTRPLYKHTLPKILGAIISRCRDCKVKPCPIAVLKFCSSTVWCCPKVELLCVSISILALLNMVKVS